MRIRNQKGKKTEKMQGKWYRYRNCNFIFLTIKVNLDQLHGFLLLSNLFCLFQPQKTLHKEIFNKFV